MSRVVIDTGPLVALLNRRDRFHGWVRGVLDSVEPPLLTCEAVISEACFLLRSAATGPDAVLELLSKGILDISFHLRGELDAVRTLMKKFETVPMSLADACLVRMTELEPRSVVLTLGGDFRVYRRNRRQIVPTIMPRDHEKASRQSLSASASASCHGASATPKTRLRRSQSRGV